jgi:RNA polymerase II subunit A-like phosphatase
MKIRSPPNLHYPISVVELLAALGDEVKRSAPLFSYTYESTVQQADRYGEVKDVKKRFPARFDSSADGVISQWYIKKGSIIERSR